MPKYLFHGSYTLEGVRGLLEVGGSSRKAHFEKNVGNLGGHVEAFYYAFGGDDIYAIADLPDNTSSAALSLALNAGGGFKVSTIVLLSTEEIDMATKKAPVVGYKPPGSL
jgi:uncharacterized protein with GYD domain